MIKNYLKLIRAEQYIKNLFVFAPLFFGRELFDKLMFLTVFSAFICFSFAASSIYIINDYFDITEDKNHPEKCKRPLASGVIKVKNAFIMMVILISISLGLASQISRDLFLILTIYFIINLFYSKWLKHIAILDINIIAVGFILRILAGAVVCGISPSVWILLITYLLAMFLGIAKRRSDVILAENGNEVRKNIEGYNLAFIDTVLGILTSVIIVCYIFYCISPEVQVQYHSNLLYLSIIFVLNGMVRYLKLAIVDKSSYSPTKIVLNDKFIQITILCWVLLMGYLIYYKK
ncbi:decaprenyl-phosphate phosphoribosyltransferase [Flavobacterium gyeonganense]|uniref:Decaprenyl-phosphate phosphoribosyltransferase n=1 Tax=Flavobacterium gyeonganense TaxID=1310418 RepID=A0ABV5H8Z9_9FLAO|nr:decaprenyl-phosphate phosphoribosyltransferase [Flavobacterium gyeonganense]